MADREYKLRITADGKQFGQEVKEVVRTLNQSGEETGQALTQGIERGIRHNIRHLAHVTSLFAGILGGALGEQIGKTFSGQSREALRGAMGGLFLGLPFGPTGALIGAGAGAITGLITESIERATKEMERLNAVAEKFHIPLGDVRELSKSLEGEELTKTLEGWSKLMEGIIGKAPGVIQALKEIGIEGKAVSALLKERPDDATVTFSIASRYLLGDRLRLGAAAREEQARNRGLGGPLGGEGEIGLPELSAESVNKSLAGMTRDEQNRFIYAVQTLAGGLDKFIESYNRLSAQSRNQPLSLFQQLTPGAFQAIEQQRERAKEEASLNDRAYKLAEENASKTAQHQYDALTAGQRRLAIEKEIADIQAKLVHDRYATELEAQQARARQLELEDQWRSLQPKPTSLREPDQFARMGLFLTSGAETYSRIYGGQSQQLTKLDAIKRSIDALPARISQEQ